MDAPQMRVQSVTATDVARAASVSRVTVSRVLNNHDNVTDEVRQRVLQAAERLGYIAPRMNSIMPTHSMASGPQPGAATEPPLHDIGFLFSSILTNEMLRANPFWSHLMNGAERAATADGIRMTYRSISRFQDAPETLLSVVSAARLDGLLLVGPAPEDTARALRSLHLPIVLVDNYLRNVPLDAVLSDNIEGARLAVEHLIAAGHRRIAFIGGPIIDSPPPMRHPTNIIPTIEQRAAGYRAALREAGLEEDDELFAAGDLTADGGYAAAQRLLEQCVPFTALFCANDETAIGAMRACHEAGRAVPGDVSVIGFDDLDVTKHLTPPLSTVRVDKEAMGAYALQALLERARRPDAVPTTTVLRVELVERGSVAAPPA